MTNPNDRIEDIGPKPQTFDIERATNHNRDYRSVAWSGRYLQVTLMSIPAGGDVGLEAHPETDQFLRLEAGQGRAQMGTAKDQLTFDEIVSEGWCMLVPAGTWHNITTIGTTPMQLYAIYAPTHHKSGNVQKTAEVAMDDKDDAPPAWSVQPAHGPTNTADLFDSSGLNQIRCQGVLKSMQLALGSGLILLGGCDMATEEPSFTVSLAQGDFEVRDYPALVTAEVTVSGDRKDAASKGFRLLAGYIFGGNTASQKIAMTAPVIQAPTDGKKIAMTAPVLQNGGDDTWTIRFIMPEGSTLENLPVPNNPEVKLQAAAPSRMAVLRFSGLARDDVIASKTDALVTFIKAQHLQAIGSPSLAQYNPPWTLWFLRRNEVMIAVGTNASA